MSKKNSKVKFGGKFTVVKADRQIYKAKNADGTITTWCSSEPFAKESVVYITKILYREPATIVFWNDGTKTVAKCHGVDKYSPETGLSICCLKKLVGSTAVKRLISDWIPDVFTTDDNGSIYSEVSIKDVRNKI